MLELTTSIMPDGSFKRRMAIIMDRRVLSAPNVNNAISNAGIIEGRFTKQEVDFLVTILRSGACRHAGKRTGQRKPCRRGLGEITIQKGTRTALWAIVVTLVFIIVYYQFSGLVAAIALLLNGLLIFGVMIFIRQPLSLPGLAGLVLTVGMSVDANVLIFERIREEKNKGSAPRLAVRNGFDRALTTIIDSNLTTLIAALVLYWIGTDQVRGFAVTLIIGICASLFTATFCSRIIFETAEKMKFLSLRMMDGVGFIKRSLFGDRALDFMSLRKACVALSVAMIGLGVTATVFRGSGILNIDFTGGTTVTIQLESPVPLDEMRRITKEILVNEEGKPIQSTLVRVEKEPADTVYTLVTSLADENQLASQLHDGLARYQVANLVTYKAKVTPLTGIESGQFEQTRRPMRLVSLRAAEPQDEPTTTPGNDEGTPGNDEGTPGNDEGQPPTATDAPSPAQESPAVAADPASAGDQAASDSVTDQPTETAEPAQVTSRFRLELSGIEERDSEGQLRNIARRSASKLKEDLLESAAQTGIAINPSLITLTPQPRPENWREDQDEAFSTWEIALPLDQEQASAVMTQLVSSIERTPLWLALSQIGGRVAGEMQQRAIAAILVSLVFIVAYIWFRFQRISYGLAAVIALVHDVLITLGVIALCHWLAEPLGFLLIEDFKIGLTEIAAFLTIIGYSLNDTIVIFDRIREVRAAVHA